jgi:hypothetical protein
VIVCQVAAHGSRGPSIVPRLAARASGVRPVLFGGAVRHARLGGTLAGCGQGRASGRRSPHKHRGIRACPPYLERRSSDSEHHLPSQDPSSGFQVSLSRPALPRGPELDGISIPSRPFHKPHPPSGAAKSISAYTLDVKLLERLRAHGRTVEGGIRRASPYAGRVPHEAGGRRARTPGPWPRLCSPSRCSGQNECLGQTGTRPMLLSRGAG